MKYTLSNTINGSLAEVVQKFTEPNGAIHWMEGLQKIERFSETPYEVGAKSNFHFIHRDKEMQISETILEQNLPGQIKFGFQSSMGYNEVEMLFEQLPDSRVKQTNNTYFELTGLIKVFGFLMKGMFKKQSLKYMTAFKEYVEQ